FGGGHFQRLVLRLPAKSRDGRVVRAEVRASGDSQAALLVCLRAHVVSQHRVGNRFDQSTAEGRRWDAEDEIAAFRGLFEVRLRDLAAGSVAAAGDGE